MGAREGERKWGPGAGARERTWGKELECARGLRNRAPAASHPLPARPPLPHAADAFLLFKAAQRAEYLTARGAGSSFNPLTGLAMEKRDFAVQGPGGMTVGIGGVVSGGVNGGGVSLPPRGGGGGGGGGRR